MSMTFNVPSNSVGHASKRMMSLSCYQSALTVQTQADTHWQAVLRAVALKARQPKWITIINPPRSLSAAQFGDWGINTDQVRVIYPREGYDNEALINAALAADTSCAIIVFTPTASPLTCYEQNKQWVTHIDPALTQRH
ncbi:hypothetical protein [Salinivibrio sp. ES.052]|uniref:hypothetical protein n=1 Tax=Salinivibrio sp. ES.052 TaxID=1882823 RepID=UPI000927562E|nr:hypothetical protein [Salinivibrio sp. ES.052]SIN84013.1 hypothetical protein SAMN05444724_0815 [Salinivibrio sp. ES.052]